MELALIQERPRDLQLRLVRAPPVGRRGHLVPPGLERALDVADAHVQVAQALAGLEGFRRGGVALYELAIFRCRAARVVQVHRAEIACQLERAAPDRIHLQALLVAQREQQGARFQERRLVVACQGEVPRVLQTRLGPPAGGEHQREGRGRDRSRHEECGTTLANAPQRRNRGPGWSGVGV